METKELYDLFFKCRNISDILSKMNLFDNSNNRNKIKKMMLDINFDINIYKERNKKYCLNCGKELLNKRNKFCSSSCSASFNNLGQLKTDDTKQKISKALKNKNINKKENVKKENVKKEKVIIKKYCLNCGKELLNKRNVFCSNSCSSIYKHKKQYNYFISNPEKFNKGNYTPKNFKDFFLLEQNNRCAICENENVWNDNPLVFVLDHIDGDASNNNRENLRLICPNCDSQTETFKSKNKNSKRRNYWKEKIINDNINGGNLAG